MPDTCQVCHSRDLEDYVISEHGHFRRCSRCGLIFNVSPEEDIVRSQEQYDDVETFAYAEARFGHKVSTARRRLDLIQTYRPSGKLLDVGCGNCAALVAAREAGFETVGIDTGEYPVARGSELGLEVQQATVLASGFPNQTFDVVTLWSVLEHIPRTAEGVAEVHRILKPGGVIALMVPNGEYLKARLSHGTYRFFNGPGARFHYVYHNPRTIRRVLTDCGFIPLSPYRIRAGAMRRGIGAAVLELLLAPSRSALNMTCDRLQLRRDILALARKPEES